MSRQGTHSTVEAAEPRHQPVTWRALIPRQRVHDNTMSVSVRNPHSVLAALEARPQDVLEIRLPTRSPQPAWQRVSEAAAAAGVPVRIARSGGGPGRRSRESVEGRTGGAEATLRDKEPVDVRDLFASPETGRGVWLALDQVQDPHNLGAIFRTAAFFGVRGIVITRHKSAPVTGTVYDVASGGVEAVPFAVESNLRQALDSAKQAGLWVLGTSEHARESLWTADVERRWLLVVGNEESGLRRLTQESCDNVYSIPASGPVGSLNVSVATGVAVSILTRPVETGR